MGTTTGTSGNGGTRAGIGAAGMSTVTGGMSGGASGTPGMPTNGGFKSCGQPAKEGMCKAKAPGVYAMKIDVDVWFKDENNPQSPLFDPSRGPITIYLKGDLNEVCEDGSGGVGTIQTCGSAIPPLLVDATCSVIQIVFPDEMWEKPMMPKVTTTGSATGFNVGDALTFVKAAGIYGIELSDPKVKWPTFMESATFGCAGGKTGAACFPDHDGDGNPGITVKIKQDGTPTAPYECLFPWSFATAPINIAQAATNPMGGASDVFIGLRVPIGGGGKIGSDCMSGVGTAESDGFDSRLIDCKLKSGGKCAVADANFVDQNLPNFHVLKAGEVPPADWKHTRPEADAKLNRTPSKGPLSAMVRLADVGTAVTCEQVRKAAFPAAN